MTPQERKVMEMALQALTHGGCPPDCKDGMTDSGGVHPWGEDVLIPCPNCQTITAIKEALAHPEQEPVAWLQIGLAPLHEGDVIARTTKPTKWNPEWWRFEPLYTTPPQRKPLTNDAARKLWSHIEGVTVSEAVMFLSVVRATEAVHGIKE